jgi:hypothetical protein
MQTELSQYLILHGHLGLPELGNFSLQEQPSRVEGNQLFPPLTSIVFEPGSVQADKHLFEYLGYTLQADEATVIRQFQDFIHTQRDLLQSNGEWHWPGIGVLKKQETGDYTLEQDPSAGRLLQPVTLPADLVWEQEQLFEETEPEPRSDSSWWIYAVILLLLGVAAIAYHYL